MAPQGEHFAGIFGRYRTEPDGRGADNVQKSACIATRGKKFIHIRHIEIPSILGD
jgi:hypothetical protein